MPLIRTLPTKSENPTIIHTLLHQINISANENFGTKLQKNENVQNWTKTDAVNTDLKSVISVYFMHYIGKVHLLD